MIGPSEEAGPPVDKGEEVAIDLLARLAEVLPAIPSVNEAALRNACLVRLRSMGLCTSLARLSEATLQRHFEQSPVFGWLARNQQLQRYPRGRWIPDLLRGRLGSHPLRWTLLWSTLGWEDSSDEAVATFRAACLGQLGPCVAPQRVLWEEESWPLRRGDLPEHVRRAFDSAHTIGEAAASLGICVSRAKQWLDDFPDLLEAWKQDRYTARLQLAKEGLREFLRSSKCRNRSLMLKLCRADVEWLRANAPEILRCYLNRIPSNRTAQKELFA